MNSLLPGAARKTETSEKDRWFQHSLLKHQRALIAYLRKMLGSEQDVQDVAQDVYLKMYNVCNYQDIEAPRAFMLRTAHNTVIQRYRHDSRVPMESVADFDELGVHNNEPDFADQVDSKRRLAILAEAVEQLPPVCRRIFVMRKAEGMSQQEIARELGISESTVEKHAVKGMRRCREYLRERGVDV